jgi:hypothetical protein
MKDMENTIYIYTTEIDREKGQYKFGQTVLDAERRVKQQQTGNSQELEMVFNVESSVTDHYVHVKLEGLGYTRVNTGGSEWFSGFKSIDEAISSLLRILFEVNNKQLKEYSPRFYQDYIKMVFEEKLKSNLNEKKEFALELAPRFGKTLWTLDLIKTLFIDYNYKVTLLPAFILNALSSFEKEFYQFKSFTDNMVFVRETDDIDSIFESEYGNKMIILPISLHTSDYENKYKFISDLPENEKVSFIDESDFGCHRKTSQDFIKFLNCELDVYMTGTAIDKVIAPLEHIDDNIIRWSYTDMLMVKEGVHPIQKFLN